VLVNENLNTKNINLRSPTDFEFLEVAQISFENFVLETAQSSGESVESLKEKFGGPPIKRSEKDFWFLVEVNNLRVGFVWFQIIEKENLAFGWDIYLEQGYRSKGIGRYVMKKCGEELLSKGIQSAKICVFEHNEIARKLYESLGFVVEKFDEQRRQFTLKLDLDKLTNTGDYYVVSN